jgi:hypothetical protein
MLPLAVSGTVVMGVAVVSAVVLLLYLLKREDEDQELERAKSEELERAESEE